ncbi:MAG: SpoIIE family protein phosphatase [Steroidobacter sp.]
MQIFYINDSSAVAHARRGVNVLAATAGFDAEDAGRAALVTTEICSNLLKHAKGGEFLLQSIGADGCGLELIGLDRGPGMLDIARCLQDGFSTGGSPGTGLGAIERIADRFDIYSQPDKGTAVLAQLWPATALRCVADVGAITVPVRGETECGDAWRCSARAGGCLLMGVDGLGHGLGAAQAANEACRVFEAHKHKAPGAILEEMHVALRPTRGAAAAVLDIDFDAGQIVFASIGNLVAAVVTDGDVKRMASFNGIVGHTMPRVRELSYPCTPRSAVILHSDGLKGAWELDRYPGLMQHCASLIAGVLYRDHQRGRDDALVVVVKRDAV